MRVGYMRVSTVEQNEERQIAELREMLLQRQREGIKLAQANRD